MGVDSSEKKGGEWVWYGHHCQCPMHIDCHKKAVVKREEMLDFLYSWQS